MTPDYFGTIKAGQPALIERPLTLNGCTVPTFWRHLTGGEKLELLRGQTVSVGGDRVERAVEVELGASTERAHRLVQLMLCDANGAPVYASLAELHREPDYLVDALTAIAREVRDRQEDSARPL